MTVFSGRTVVAADLEYLVAVWPTLPDKVRKQILGLAERLDAAN
jgi:hypothetical protein